MVNSWAWTFNLLPLGWLVSCCCWIPSTRTSGALKRAILKLQIRDFRTTTHYCSGQRTWWSIDFDFGFTSHLLWARRLMMLVVLVVELAQAASLLVRWLLLLWLLMCSLLLVVVVVAAPNKAPLPGHIHVYSFRRRRQVLHRLFINLAPCCATRWISPIHSCACHCWVLVNGTRRHLVSSGGLNVLSWGRHGWWWWR